VLCHATTIAGYARPLQGLFELNTREDEVKERTGRRRGTCTASIKLLRYHYAYCDNDEAIMPCKSDENASNPYQIGEKGTSEGK